MHSAAPTVRETVDDLSRRLARICAAASSLTSLSADVRQGVPPTDLMPFLEQLDRELMLASNQLTIVRDRAKQDLDSLDHTAEHDR
jgi:hypothetical protein